MSVLVALGATFSKVYGFASGFSQGKSEGSAESATVLEAKETLSSISSSGFKNFSKITFKSSKVYLLLIVKISGCSSNNVCNKVALSVIGDVFGFEVFRGNTFLSFQSNLNIPTPLDYVIGPGDKLFIDIYGQSEAYYQVEINPEGTIILENFGPIHLSGLTVKNATKRIKNKLSKVYSMILFHYPQPN